MKSLDNLQYPNYDRPHLHIIEEKKSSKTRVRVFEPKITS